MAVPSIGIKPDGDIYSDTCSNKVQVYPQKPLPKSIFPVQMYLMGSGSAIVAWQSRRQDRFEDKQQDVQLIRYQYLGRKGVSQSFSK